jgi:hypothetical protein
MAASTGYGGRDAEGEGSDCGEMDETHWRRSLLRKLKLRFLHRQ